MSKILQEIYKSIPSSNCKGLCQHSCGPVPYSELELEQWTLAGITPPGHDKKTLTCDKLKDGKCSMYNSRPYICRLWGSIRELACPHGCLPERWVTPKESMDHLRRLGDAIIPDFKRTNKDHAQLAEMLMRIGRQI